MKKLEDGKRSWRRGNLLCVSGRTMIADNDTDDSESIDHEHSDASSGTPPEDNADGDGEEAVEEYPSSEEDEGILDVDQEGVFGEMTEFEKQKQ